jgi:hypothetical protein
MEQLCFVGKRWPYFSCNTVIQIPSPVSSVGGHLTGTPNSSNLPSPVSDSAEDSGTKLSNYLHQLSGQAMGNWLLLNDKYELLNGSAQPLYIIDFSHKEAFIIIIIIIIIIIHLYEGYLQLQTWNKPCF